MRLVLATECWGPAHAGSTGAAWWVAHGLAARGHSVDVVAAARYGDPRHHGITVRVLDATWPSAKRRRVAFERVVSSPITMALVQRQLLAQVGATTDPSSVNLRHAGGVIGFGLRSPHVRALMSRALGRAPSAIHLTGEDRRLVDVPLARQATRGHSLFTHWAELGTELASTMRSSVVTWPAGQGPDGPGSPPADRIEGARGPVALVVLPEIGAPRQDYAAHCSRAGLRVRFVSGSDLASYRFDAAVRDAAVTILDEGDSGDLAAVALRVGRPLIVSLRSSAVADARRSGAAWVGEPGDLPSALVHALSTEGQQRAFQGTEFGASALDWDHLAPILERELARPAV